MKFRLIIDPEKDEEIVITAKKKSRLTEELEALVIKYEGNDRITVQGRDCIKEISFESIECVTVIGNKTTVVASNGEKYHTGKRLYEIENQLPQNFIRINKSAIANKNFIDRFAVSYSGGVDAVFKSGYRDYVSRRCFAKIKSEVLK